MRRLLLIALACAGCGGDELDAERVTVAGQPAQVVNAERGAPLVVWLHSKGSDERATTQELRAPFFEALAERGYAIASSRAHGDAWGNAASVEDYRALIAWARREYAPSKILLVGESMGGLAALELAARPPEGVVGWVGISPVTNARWVQRSEFAPEARAAWRGRPPAARPVVPGLVFASRDDRLVPLRSNPPPRRTRLVACSGDHLDASCRQAAAVARFFDAL